MNRLIRPWGLGPARLVGRSRSGGAWQNVTDKESAFSLSVYLCVIYRSSSAVPRYGGAIVIARPLGLLRNVTPIGVRRNHFHGSCFISAPAS